VSAPLTGAELWALPAGFLLGNLGDVLGTLGGARLVRVLVGLGLLVGLVLAVIRAPEVVAHPGSPGELLRCVLTSC
jgi:hypothetical protein